MNVLSNSKRTSSPIFPSILLSALPLSRSPALLLFSLLNHLHRYKVPKDKEQEFINKFMISPGYPTADFVYPPATPEHTFEEVVLVKTNRPANADIH